PRLRGVAAGHRGAELGELVDHARRARVVVPDATRGRREAVRERHLELLERRHLPVEPRERVRPVYVRPAQARAQACHPELAQPADGGLESRIFEMKPLTDAELGNALEEGRQRTLRRAVLTDETHVEMA